MSKFEVVSRFLERGPLYIPNLPKRSTKEAAGYDFEVAEDIIVPSYIESMSNLIKNQSCLSEKWNNQYKNQNLVKDWPNLGPEDNIPIDLSSISKLMKLNNVTPTLVPTGIKCKIDQGWYLKLTVRSSLPLKHWLILANGEGVIDGDYYNNSNNEGEIFFQLINLSPFSISLKAGDKIGQGIFVPYGLVENDKYGEGETRKGGFGSTSEYINAPYVIGDTETTIPIEPNYITTTNVEEDKYYQITLNDITKML